MADTRPTPVGFFRGIYLSVLLLYSPKRFLVQENKDIEDRNNYSGYSAQEARAFIVRRAFFISLFIVLASGVVGYCAGLFLQFYVGCASGRAIIWLQVFGALNLLWGTLFIRGWEIQSYAGVTLTERVNRWLYRFLYCLGTSVFVCSLAWLQC